MSRYTLPPPPTLHTDKKYQSKVIDYICKKFNIKKSKRSSLSDIVTEYEFSKRPSMLAGGGNVNNVDGFLDELAEEGNVRHF